MPTAFAFRVGRFFSFGEKGYSGIELDEQIVVFAGSDLEFIFEEIVRLFRAERLKIKLRIRLEYLVDKLFERTPGSARRLQNAHGEVFHFFPRERLFFYGGLLLALLFLGGGLFYRFIDFSLLRTVRFLFGLFFGQKVFEYEKAVAGFHERLGRLSFSRADDEDIAFSEALGKTGKVAVAGKQAKGVDVAGIQDIHRVDDHTGVSGVFTRGIGVLLNGSDGVLVNDIPPPLGALTRKVAVHTAVSHFTQDDKFFFQSAHVLAGHVIGVDKQGDGIVCIFHIK